jgi:HD-GYP domain-containing protein (c-di-GMP phosphodiesterase class II)
MSATIAVEELRIGMYVHLDGGWLSHPFPLSSFRITTPEQIATIRGLGLAEVRWVPEKSELAPELDPAQAAAVAAAAAAAAQAESAVEAASRARREQLNTQRAAQQQAEKGFGEAARSWREAFDAVSAKPLHTSEVAGALTRKMLDGLNAEGDICIRLLGAPQGDRSAAHAVNVAVISMLIGRTFGFADEEMLDLGTGALLHDVGKIDLPDRVRHLDERFTSAELNAYRDHVAKGVAQGRRMQLSAGALSVLAQHHEHADGSGFPGKLVTDAMSPAARIVAIVNRYDNLCNPALLSRAMTPHEAVSMLFAQGKGKFDSGVLNAFIRMMGVYPAGSLVQLTDDRYAMVVGVNSSRPLKPRVLVHDPKVPRNEALLLNLEQLPELGIRRSLAPAKLPPAALQYLDPRPRVAYYFEPLSADATAASAPTASRRLDATEPPNGPASHRAAA